MVKHGIVTSVTIEEALQQTHFGRFNYFVIVLSGLVINNVVLESVGVSFSLPVLKCDLDLSYSQQGMLGAVAFIGIISSSHLWGFLADTTGRKRIMQPALMLGFFITVLSSFSPNFETLVVMRFLNGVLLSAGSATVFAYLGEFHCQKYRDRSILSAAFISAFLSIFFPVIAWLFINQNWQFTVPYIGIEFKPWRSYFLACGILGFICSLLLFQLPESPKYLLTIGRADEALDVLKRIHRTNTRGKKNQRNCSFTVTQLLHDLDTQRNDTSHCNLNKGGAIANLLRSMWHQTAPLFMRQHIRKTFLASLIQFITFFSAHGVYMWFPYILNNSMQFTQRYAKQMSICEILKFTQSSNFTQPSNSTSDHNEEYEYVCATKLEISTYQHTIMLEIIYVCLLLSVIYAIGRFGRIQILFVILTVCGACGVLGLIIEAPLVAIYAYVVYLCCGLGTTVVNAIVVDIYPTNLRAMAVCISLMLGRIGSVIGSIAIGSFIDRSCEAALFSSCGSLILAGFLGLLLPKPERSKDLNI